ncbi:ApcC hetero-tetramer Cut9-Hcn1 [Gigaspora margarita]|uniref:ApcC hetero-tetramer Cut9-Hcn1 n=1 Tax=Gigaspora margarita TaxID=4874 RepID=A0A8H3X5Q4_GIGMA|nr:ApcC hetero-tetramer Cut9-Hcn1 [Gigaspora margarita]
MNYISMLKKYDHVTEIQEAQSELENKFRLSNNADILLSHADELYTQCRFKEYLEVTTKLLELDMYNQARLPIHIVCLHEFREKNKFFLFAHELVEHSPDKAITWFSVGCYNFLIDQNEEARRYFMARHLLWILIAGQRGSKIISRHLQAKNLLSAEEYLLTSSQICESDPLVAEEAKCRPQVWEKIWINLDHAFRQLGELDNHISKK